MASSGDVLYRCPMLSSRLRSWAEARQSLRTSQRPSDWAPALSRVLQAIGWPGDRGLNSSEYQTLEVWNELLSELACLDSVTGRIPLDTAVRMLRRLASSRQFQPESEPAPVQILGVFESSGLRFDRLWIMGMHDNAWPPAPAPDPLLAVSSTALFQPASLLTGQGTGVHSAAHHAASGERSHHRRELSPTGRRFRFESEPAVSRIALKLPWATSDSSRRPGMSSSFTARPAWKRWRITMDLRAAMPHSTEEVPCSSCRPYARSRRLPNYALERRRWDQPEPGLSALDRGQLIHRILERVWQELKSHEGLLATPEERLEELVRTTVGVEVQSLSRRRRALRRPRFAAIEQMRLERVIGDWLLLEMERRPFTVLEQEEKPACDSGRHRLAYPLRPRGLS